MRGIFAIFVRDFSSLIKCYKSYGKISISDCYDPNAGRKYRDNHLSRQHYQCYRGGQTYEFVPFTDQPKGAEFTLRKTIMNTGEVLRRGRLTMNGRTVSVRLWDRESPIPDGVSIAALEFGKALKGGEVVCDNVQTTRGLLRVPRIYARMKPVVSEIRQKLDDIDLSLNWGAFAHNYFDRPASWFYDKLNGIGENGCNREFTEEELARFKDGLYDLADRIRCAADRL